MGAFPCGCNTEPISTQLSLCNQLDPDPNKSK